MLALVNALFGLIAGVLVALGGSAALMNSWGMSEAAAGFGVASILVMPIVYAIGGLIIGALGAWFYNLVAGWVGGVRLEIV